MIYSGVGGTDNPKNLFNGVNHSLAELGPSRSTSMYASFLRIACKQVSETACALHPNIFQQPPYKWYSDRLLGGCLYFFVLKKGFYADFGAVCFYSDSAILVRSEYLTALILVSFKNFAAGKMEDILETQIHYGKFRLYLFKKGW
jgi:hypothetical protein